VGTNDFEGKHFTAPNISQKDGKQGIYNGTKIGAERVEYAQNQARFPANVIHDGSDEVVKLFPNENEQSAARFFYTAKAQRSEREMGLYEMEEETTTDGREKPIDNAYNRGEPVRRNIHPTVKPLDLMRYLVRLITPKGGIVLDPYLGSGTTAVAAKLEGMRYIGMELEPQYVAIAEGRIAECEADYATKAKMYKNENVSRVYDVFDFITATPQEGKEKA
jgi:site-specific DNA-methyltransferase (adenine-specific)